MISRKKKTEIRPMYNSSVTPYGAINSRSPLVSLIFPSLKDKIRNFEEECTKRNLSKQKKRSMYVKPKELDRIMEEEATNKLNRTAL